MRVLFNLAVFNVIMPITVLELQTTIDLNEMKAWNVS